MSVMGKPVWAVVCGAVRNEFELYLVLSLLSEYRSKGWINGIVISTWKGEIENIPGLRGKLDQLGVSYVESDPLDENISKVTLIGPLRQFYQFRQGLRSLPEDVFVLKCRTDYCVDGLHLFESTLKNSSDLTTEKYGLLNFGLSYKIGVHILPAYSFGGFAELTFLGYKNDLLAMTKMQCFSYMYDQYLYVGDYYWYVNLFHGKIPFIDQFLAWMPKTIWIDWEKLLTDYCRSLTGMARNEFELPNLLNKFYAIWFMVLKSCFYSVSPKVHNRPCGDILLTDVFSADSRLGLSQDQWYQFTNMYVLEKIVSGECIRSKGYCKLLAEMMRLTNDVSYLRKCEITNEDYDELSSFIKDKMHENPDKWLMKRNVFEEKQSATYSFDSAFDMLYGKNLMNPEKEYLLKYVYSSGDWCASTRRMEVIIEWIEKEFPDLYKSSLGGIGRFAKPWILKRIANMAIVTDDEKFRETVGMGFERYKFRLYNLPCNTEKISALYNYSRYLEKQKAYDIPKNVYRLLVKIYKRDVLENTSDSWMDLSYKLLLSVANVEYKQYHNKKNIQYAIDFIIDEFGVEVLNEEAKKYLLKYATKRRIWKPFREGRIDAFESLIEYMKVIDDNESAKVALEMLAFVYFNQSIEKRHEADTIVKGYVEKKIVASCDLVKAQNAENILEPDYGVLPYSTKYVLLCNQCVCLRNKTILQEMKRYIKHPLDMVTYHLFSKIVGNERIKFAFTKANKEIWMYYSMPKYELFARENFLLPRNDEGDIWPYGDIASMSPFAFLITLTSEDVFCSIEFCSIPCLAKKYVFEFLNKAGYKGLIVDNNLNRLRTISCHVNDEINYDLVTEKLLSIASKIGEDVENAYEYASMKLVNDI